MRGTFELVDYTDRSKALDNPPVVVMDAGPGDNDSIESYEYYDACCPKCALEMAEKYVTNAYTGCNTKTIEIEHVRGLRSGTDRTYKHDIAED